MCVSCVGGGCVCRVWGRVCVSEGMMDVCQCVWG